MTPALQLGLPILQLLGAVVISRRISWRAHPALISYLASEAITQFVALAGIPIYPYAIPLQLVIRTAVVFEVLAFARIPIATEDRWRYVGLALSACAIATACTPGIGMVEAPRVFRQYYLLILCAALLSVVIRRWAHPMLECRRHRICRLGVAAWILTVALAGTFIRGGLAHLLIGYNRRVWDFAGLVAYGLLVLTIGAMAAAMAASLPLRKRAVKVADDWRVGKMAA